jgi:amino acid adenylation domain-containing protein
VISGAPLHALLEGTAARFPDRIAVDVPGGPTMTFKELDRLSDRARDRLVAMGVKPGDRVGITMRKSIDFVASVFGVLKCGAAYVPVDADAPAARGAYIFNDCSVAAVITERRLEAPLASALAAVGAPPAMLVIDESDGPVPLRAALEREQRNHPTGAHASVHPDPDALAYILYTSGSTGKPKGVMLSHRNARSFIDWVSSVLKPSEHDVFSSHAPFHFDLSILDMFTPVQHGATLVLIGEQLGKDPLRLAAVIAEKRISVWYSTPSILSLLAQYGKLDRYDYGALRAVLFAGEVFPVPQLRALRALWRHPRYLNLYGPTETNVCTFYELPAETPRERTEPYPIGRTCTNVQCRVVDTDGRTVARGTEGELVVTGDGVMQGYWNLPDNNARAFLIDDDGARWYRTGDIVVEDAAGDYVFRGRRDRMVKRHGYRIELAEIEAGLANYPTAHEVAVVALPDAAGGVCIKAYLTIAGERPSLIELKQFCADRLPRYMAPDAFTFVDALPRTSTDKIDYQTLVARG